MKIEKTEKEETVERRLIPKKLVTCEPDRTRTDDGSNDKKDKYVSYADMHES